MAVSFMETSFMTGRRMMANITPVTRFSRDIFYKHSIRSNYICKKNNDINEKMRNREE